MLEMESPEDIRELMDNNGPELLARIHVDDMFKMHLVKERVITSEQRRNIENERREKQITFILDAVRSTLNIAGFRAALRDSKQYSALSILDTETTNEGEPIRVRIDAQPITEMQATAKLDSLPGLQKLKEHYITTFNESTSSCSPWKYINMEETYVKTDLVYRERRANISASNLKLDENNLFDGKSKLVVIEGNPGSGKTTLMERYAWQWAEGKAEDFINNLDLVIMCRGASIDENEDIEQSIKAFLIEFDREGSLYTYYKKNEVSSLLIFEAMDEASEEARKRVVQYVKGRPADQPIIITARTDCFKKTPMRIDILAERTGFTPTQATKYFKDTFSKRVFQDVENLIDAGVISADFLESPYNCKGLGLLIKERIENGESKFHYGVEFSSTMLVKAIFAGRLERVNLKAEDQLFKNLSHFALWATIQDKHEFTERDMKKFNLVDEKVFLCFFRRRARMGDSTYTFPHETEKDYLAALAVTELMKIKDRDAFYRIFASDRKYASVLRLISGLLDEENIKEGREFQMMFAHAKLLGGVKHHESAHKEAVLAHARMVVKSILKDLSQCNTEHSEIPEPEFLSEYRRECEHFISGDLAEEERQVFLDGGNGRVCIALDVMDMFEDFYLRLKELSIPNKMDYDIIRSLIGQGLTKIDPVKGEMSIFPVGKDGRWGQTFIKPNKEVWIVVHTVDDAIKALQRLPVNLEPRNIGLYVPARLPRRVWGIPPLQNFKPLLEMIPRNGLKELYIWIASPIQLIGSFPPEVEGLALFVCPCSWHEEEQWTQFLKYMFSLPFSALAVCHQLSGWDLMNDGCLKALYQIPWAVTRLKGFKVLDGTITLADLQSFHKEVLVQIKGVSFLFDRTLISDVASVGEFAKLADEGCFIAVQLEQAWDATYPEDECNRAIASKWSCVEPTEESQKVYLNTLDATTRLECVDYELPQCREEENVQFIKEILHRVICHFKNIRIRPPLVKLHMGVWIPAVKDYIVEKENNQACTLRWYRKDTTAADIAEIGLHMSGDQKAN